MIDQISIVMPTYNAMPFLKQAVESILAQSFKDFEFLIVNDGSTDGSKEYLDLQSDSRIRVIHQSRRGLVAALNVGIEEAANPWIARMDADDIALPHRLSRQVAFLNLNPEYVLVSCAFAYVGARGSHLKAAHVQHLQSPPSYKPALDPVILHQGTLYKKESILTVGAYRELTPAEDLDLWLRLDEASYKMACTPEVLMLVRILPGGISSRSFLRQRVAWKYVLACAAARKAGLKEPNQEIFSHDNWPCGWRRLKAESGRQFRLGGADLGAGYPFRAALRLALAFLLRPGYVFSKLRTYSFARKHPS